MEYQNINKSVVNKLKEWRESPLQFVKECLKVTPTKQQLAVLTGESSIARNKRTSIRSGHGPGKSAVASWLILWFIVTRPFAKVICTAPTNRQLTDILLSELSKWLRGSLVADEFLVFRDAIRHKEAPKEWWIRFISPSVRSSKDEQAETLAGLHDEHILVVADEACHDDQTEILTEEGFKLFSELSGNERVLTMDPDTMVAEYVYPDKYHVYDYDGELAYYDADNLNFAVTPNHRFFYSTRKSDKLRFTPLKDIGKNTRISIPKGFKWVGVHLDTYISYDLYQSGWEPFPIREWLCLLGIFISEGSFRKGTDKVTYTGITISQQNLNGREFIETILKALRLDYKVSGNDYIVYSTSLASHLALLCGDGFINKHVPDIVKSLTPELINIFLDAFCIGDGYFKPFNDEYRRILYTSSPKLADDLQELLFKSGKNATLTKRKLAGRQTWIKDHIATSSVDGFMMGESTTDTPFSVRTENIKYTKYIGKIYCLTVNKTGLLFTRRDGKCLWSGNSGIPDPVYIPLEGILTKPDNKVLLIGNMTRNSGYFYDTHFNSEIKKNWNLLHWDSRESENVDKSYPEYMATKYGVESNIFRIRVEGNPPLQDENTLIPLYAAEMCIGSEIMVAEDEPLYLGVDVARYGDDVSIILPRRGLQILAWETFRKLNTIDLGGFINQTYQELEASGCAIDVIGVGAGVADWLEKHNLKNLYQVNVSTSSSDITKYHRLRDELWVKVRDNCLLGKYSFPDTKVHGEKESLGQQLANELSTVRYTFNNHGGYVVESKKDLKTRGIASPNIADALCLTEYFHNTSTRVFAKKQPEGFRPRRYSDASVSSVSWLGI